MENIRLASLQNKKRTIIQVGNIQVEEDFVVIAGPCSVESEEQTLNIAHAIKKAGATMIRGGAARLISRAKYGPNCAY
jgi:3-deoxy-7-phosphoheptulonate synthase